MIEADLDFLSCASQCYWWCFSLEELFHISCCSAFDMIHCSLLPLDCDGFLSSFLVWSRHSQTTWSCASNPHFWVLAAYQARWLKEAQILVCLDIYSWSLDALHIWHQVGIWLTALSSSLQRSCQTLIVQHAAKSMLYCRHRQLSRSQDVNM